MASGAPAYDPVEVAFRLAIQEFKTSIGDKKLFAKLLETKSIDEVYDATEAIQEEQGKKGHLRHLAKIEPFLLGLKEYVGVIEVFMQAKPDVIALIWGPIKLLIQWASVLKTSFDAIVNATADVGVRLPEFGKMARLFHENKRIQDVLALFFKDVLDFYAIALKFFSLPNWKYVIAMIWPQYRERINIVIKNMDRHTLLLRGEVNIEHIQKEYEARSRAFQHYEAMEKAHRRQEFDSMKTEISPQNFADVLDRIRGRMCADTGKWLASNLTYKRWLNSDEPSSKNLWIFGIPGAGKTFLSCSIIDFTEKKGETLLAFLSYQEKQEYTALRTVQSLVFQLASKDETLQDIVRQSTLQEIRQDLDGAARLLCTLIDSAGRTYIIVDGIDEIDSIECSRLLQCLLKTSESCRSARLLFSSRAEDSISKKLKSIPSLRVDENNYNTIDAYVKLRSDEWIQERELSHEITKEFKSLLMPLASKSKGMFLYASIIMSSIWLLDDIDEVQNELKILPERLDDMVNNLEPQIIRDKARKILGWAACSPTPLTIWELEQALLVSTDDDEGNKQVITPLNAVKICGPVIEIADGYVNLVHFTFKEYLLSPRVDGHIKPSDAVSSLTLCCLAYLCQKHHDINIDDESIASSILTGTYRLKNFATLYWLQLVETCFLLKTEEEPYCGIINQLNTLMDRRNTENEEYKSTSAESLELRGLSKTNSKLYRWLCLSGKFRSTFWKSDTFDLDGSESCWTKHDPTTFSHTSFRINHALNQILCKDNRHENCQCNLIKRHYGVRSFKCPVPSCINYRHGFESRALQKSHANLHKRPWKCNRDDCTFSGGFISKKMRDQHEKLFHPIRAPQLHINTKAFSEEGKDIFSDLITLNRVEEVKMLLNPIDEDERLVAALLHVLGNIPDNVSAEMIDLLLQSLKRASEYSVWNNLDSKTNSPKFAKDWVFSQLLHSSVVNTNFYLFKYLVQRLLDDYYGFQFYFVNLHDPDYTIDWLKEILKPEMKDFQAELLRIFSAGKKLGQLVLISNSLLRATRKDKSKVQLLLSWWKAANLFQMPQVATNRALKNTQRDLGKALQLVAKENPCKELVEYLLELGADVNYVYKGSSTALQHAARCTSELAAELMVFLLQRGANPYIVCAHTKKAAGDERGAKQIERWTGKTWDEHIEEVKMLRQPASAPNEVTASERVLPELMEYGSSTVNYTPQEDFDIDNHSNLEDWQLSLLYLEHCDTKRREPAERDHEQIPDHCYNSER